MISQTPLRCNAARRVKLLLFYSVALAQLCQGQLRTSPFSGEFYLTSTAIFCLAIESAFGLVTGQPAPRPFINFLNVDKKILSIFFILAILLLVDAVVALLHLENVFAWIAYGALLYFVISVPVLAVKRWKSTKEVVSEPASLRD